MASTITTSAIITEYGNYRNTQRFPQDVRQFLLQPSVTERYFNKFENSSAIWEATRAVFAKPLQRFAEVWSPRGGVTLTPHKIVASHIKIDDEIYPDQAIAAWKQFLNDTPKMDRKEWTFTKWYFRELAAQGDNQMERDEIYKGAQTTLPAAGTATTVGTTINGIKKLINDAITATTAQSQTLGTFPTTAAGMLTYVRAFVNGISLLEREGLDFVFMSESNAALFREGCDLAYNSNYMRHPDQAVVPYNEHIKVVGLPSMASSNKIWASPKWNRICFIHAENGRFDMRLENVDRLVKGYTDYFYGLGFAFSNFIYCNEQELS